MLARPITIFISALERDPDRSLLAPVFLLPNQALARFGLNLMSRGVELVELLPIEVILVVEINLDLMTRDAEAYMRSPDDRRERNPIGSRCLGGQPTGLGRACEISQIIMQIPAHQYTSPNGLRIPAKLTGVKPIKHRASELQPEQTMRRRNDRPVVADDDIAVERAL